MTYHGMQAPPSVNQNGQYRMPYAPGRDFVNVYPQMIRCNARFFNSNQWPELKEMVAKLEGCTLDEAHDKICDAADVYVKFVAESCRDSGTEKPESYGELMDRVGWTKLSHPVRFAYMALVGSITSGQLLASIRDVSLWNEVPPAHIKAVCKDFWDEAEQTESRKIDG